jgi:hypothetical protein
MIGILAKLAGQNSSRAIAEWAQLRKRELALLFALRHQRLPHFSTWSRSLGKGCDPAEVEEVLGQFFAKPSSQSRRLGERQLCIDGKTLRGTIPLGKAHGVHLLAAYLPKARGSAGTNPTLQLGKRTQQCSQALIHDRFAGNCWDRGCTFFTECSIPPPVEVEVA